MPRLRLGGRVWKPGGEKRYRGLMGVIVRPQIPSNSEGVSLRTVLTAGQVLVAWTDGSLRIENASDLKYMHP